ncbi:hypothetical protein N8T08_001679 [Aspergillus melleus]|uniref:Uncharacterized protein n=1 Tax=Aspergillus melleus TaxID=138277 RepID=A0ACC3AN25_9EURO|nr:hypothetical protein N8T08_001679 [Aspergillus melleus]
MGLGIVEDSALAHVPGTSDILQSETSNEHATINPNLKYDRSGSVPILLVPQPSDGPNDPLNWPLWKRDVTLLALSFVSVLCATTSSLMAANTVTIALHYGKSFTSVALLTGYHLCGVGVAGILIVPTARVWGKRHLFLLGNLLMVTEIGANTPGRSNDYTILKESHPLGEQQKHARASNPDSSMASSWNENPTRQETPSKASYHQSLKPFNGRKTDENFFKLLLRPFPLFFHPAILWACLIQGAIIGWTVFIGVVLAAIFLGPPLWFNEVQTGYLYTGAFIGSILGLILSGLLSDSMNRIMIKLNKGRYEPEFRILLVLFQLVFCGVGLYGFGIVAEDVGRYGWLVVDVFFAFVVIGMVMGAVASALYIVDAHRDIAIESFTCMLIFKNIFSFILTFFAYDWLVSNGIRPAFLAISSIQMGICVLSIPMYILGKRNRSFFTRHDILKILRL